MKDSELQEMVKLWADAGLPRRPKGRDSMRNLKKQHKAAPELFLGAFADGKMLGVVLASDDGRKGWINRLAVVPKARRTGVARLLIDRSERALRRRGRKIFCAHIEDYNETSMQLFGKVGYHKEEGIYYYTKREDPEY